MFAVFLPGVLGARWGGYLNAGHGSPTPLVSLDSAEAVRVDFCVEWGEVWGSWRSPRRPSAEDPFNLLQCPIPLPAPHPPVDTIYSYPRLVDLEVLGDDRDISTLPYPAPTPGRTEDD